MGAMACHKSSNPGPGEVVNRRLIAVYAVWLARERGLSGTTRQARSRSVWLR
jgi:hypothetical protein